MLGLRYILNVTQIKFYKVFLPKILRPISANIFNQNRATFLSKRASRPPQSQITIEKENPELEELFEFHFDLKSKNRKKTVILNC